jgi:hypothetical protein
MKKISTSPSVFLLLVFSLLFNLSLSAQTNTAAGDDGISKVDEPPVSGHNKISGYIETNYLRHYLWRGAVFGNNDVSQPELHLDYKNFSIALSPNLNLIPKNLSSEFYKKKVVFDEQDLELGFQNSAGKLEYQVLLYGYFYFNQLDAPNTGEVYTKLQYPVWKNTKLYTENVVDVAAYKGAFFNSTGLLYEKELNKLAIEYKIYTGFANSRFNDAYFETTRCAMNFAGTSLNLEYGFKNFYVAAKGEYNHYTDKNIRAATGLKQTNNISFYIGKEF